MIRPGISIRLTRKGLYIVTIGICVLIIVVLIWKLTRPVSFAKVDSFLTTIVIISTGGLALSVLGYILPMVVRYVEEGTIAPDPPNPGMAGRNTGFEFDLPQTNSTEEEPPLIDAPVWRIQHDAIPSPDKLKLHVIEEHTTELHSDVFHQISKISRSGSINLTIGLLLAITGIVLVIILVFSPPPSANAFDTGVSQWERFLIHTIPRLSIVVFIEFFSFFFLNMYKRNNDEIKYFNNEKTNIESKILALKISVLYGDKNDIKSSIQSLNNVDRNSFLKKGESTIEIEKLKLEKSGADSALESVAKIGKVFSQKTP